MKVTNALKRVVHHPLFWHAVPLIFIAFVVLFFPFRYRFEFDHDEGINAIKSYLNIKGYQLFSDIWSDQPPVFNMLLTVWFRIFGLNINAGRGFVLLFSTSILWMSIQYLRRFFGELHAVLGVLAIILLPYYLRLSVSIMIGLPAVAFALLSFIALALWHESGKSGWLLLSASALGFSIMTKLFTAFLAPILFSGILISEWTNLSDTKNWLKACIPSIIWGIVLVVVTGSILFVVVKPENLDQLFQVHLSAGESELFSPYAENKISIYFTNLMGSLPVIILALVGGLYAFRSKVWTAMYLVAWLFAGAVLLYVNVPFWYHQTLLITIPAAILAAIGAVEGLRAFQSYIRSRKSLDSNAVLGIVSLTLVIGYLAVRLPATLEDLDLKLPNLRALTTEDYSEYGIVASMWNYASKTDWVYTDRPIFAFRADLPVPPELAVMSKKRVAGGALSEEEILEILLKYQPEQVFTERFDLDATQEYMSTRNFRRVDTSKKYRLYVRNDIIQ